MSLDNTATAQSLKLRKSVHSSALPHGRLFAAGTVVTVQEVVFFARLEVLKGIHEFCGALDVLAQLVRRSQLRLFNVTFLGNANMGQIDAVKFLKDRAAAQKWPFHLEIYTDRIQPEAIAYMRGGAGRVSVLASLVENSPYTVLECLALGFPFIASDVGGIAELILPEDRPRVLFRPTAKDLAQRLQSILEGGIIVARGSSTPVKTREQWLDFHNAIAHDHFRTAVPLPSVAGAPALSSNDKLQLPHVTVCVPTHDRGELIFKTIEALMAQRYAGSFDIIVVDDGSTSEAHLRVLDQLVLFDSESKASRARSRDDAYVMPIPSIRVIRQANLYPGAARNRCVREAASTPYVAFMDDDDIPKPNWLDRMMTAALHTNADVVTCMFDFFYGDGVPSADQTPALRYLPLGDALDLGLWHNVFGAYSALVRRSAFLEIGGTQSQMFQRQSSR